MYTIPSQAELIKYAANSKPYMRSNTQPWAVVYEGALTIEQCDNICLDASRANTYQFPACGARTQEFIHPLPDSFAVVERFLERINAEFFQYDLDDEYAAWVQTYKLGDSYKLHFDQAPGQMRKLTALVMLSGVYDYVGGALNLYLPPQWKSIPKTRGTIVVYPSWVMHSVSEVMSGTRKTLNLGAWGPPFV